MRVHSTYRTVILRVHPTPEQERKLLKAEQSVFEFIEMSRRELQRLLYNKFKNDGIEPRTLELLAQRFTGSMGEKAVIPFDRVNSKFICENGNWYVEVKLARGRNQREKLLLTKPDNDYYDVIENLSKYPFILVRENDKWFVYVSIPVEPSSNGLVVGIDFNMHKWVAAPYEGRPLFFDVRRYEETIEELQRKISRAHQKKDLDRVRKLHQKICETVKHAHGTFLSAIKERYGICTLAVEDVETMFKLTEKDSKMINNWLYAKTAMRKFILRAMAKGFNVVEVDPRGTTRTCHRCGSEVKIYGRRKKLIECPKCGLRDYNRDLNAARNIAICALSTLKEVVGC